MKFPAVSGILSANTSTVKLPSEVSQVAVGFAMAAGLSRKPAGRPMAERRVAQSRPDGRRRDATRVARRWRGAGGDERARVWALAGAGAGANSSQGDDGETDLDP